MLVNFIQGIVTYPYSGTTQQFLQQGTSSQYVSISTNGGRVDVTFAHGNENYLFSESTDIANAWGPVPATSDSWLYWNLDTATAARTFGYTSIEPTYGPTAPTPQEDQHWFDTSINQMKVYTGGNWRNVIRVFAAKYNNGVFTPMGTGFPLTPFAGTQVGVTAPGIVAGRILADDTGMPVRRRSGIFFTTEDDFFVNGSPVNVIRLEANVFTATALENVAAYQVVKFSQFGKVNLATYNDLQTTAIALSMEDIGTNVTGTMCMQGYITNPAWNWPVVGAPLWVDGAIPGNLVDVDPHVTNPSAYSPAKPPVARVISPASVFFDQGLGGYGNAGTSTSSSTPIATTTVLGKAKLSVAPVDPHNPIVVGTNDPRLTTYVHPATHDSSMITSTPYGDLTGPYVFDDLKTINDLFLKKTGGSMAGRLFLSGDPVDAEEAATKAYVDSVAGANNNLGAILHGSATFNGTGVVNVVFAVPKASSTYKITLGCYEYELIFIDSAFKTPNGFRLVSSNPTSTATVDWIVVG